MYKLVENPKKKPKKSVYTFEEVLYLLECKGKNKHRDYLESTCGVYLLLDKVTGSKYVGSASKGFLARWETHIKELGGATHLKKHLALFGFDDMLFCVEQVVKDNSLVLGVEVLIKDKYKSINYNKYEDNPINLNNN